MNEAPSRVLEQMLLPMESCKYPENKPRESLKGAAIDLCFCLSESHYP